LLEVARTFSLRTVDDLLASVGYHKTTPNQVMNRLLPTAVEETVVKEDIIPVEKRKSPPPDEGIKVRGVDDVMMRMAKCCNPLPGEEIIGYITRGRGSPSTDLPAGTLTKGILRERSRFNGIQGRIKPIP